MIVVIKVVKHYFLSFGQEEAALKSIVQSKIERNICWGVVGSEERRREVVLKLFS